MSNTNIAVTESDFETTVLNSDKPVLVDFWAAWCGPCLAVAPVVEELAREYADKAKVLKVNVDENQDLARKYNIRSIPALALFDQGELKEMAVGTQSKPGLENLLNKYTQ